MRQVDRRGFFGLTVLGAAGVCLPGGLAAFFSPGRPGPGGIGRSDVRRAWRRARASGRPLLVLLIPAVDEEKHERGLLWGQVLNHGSDECLADLALCTVACATGPEVLRAFPDLAARVLPRTLAVLVEPDESAACLRVEREDLALPEISWGEPEPFLEWERAARARIAAIEAALRRALAPDEETIAARRALCLAAVPEGERAGLEARFAAGTATPRDVRAAPALARAAAEADPEKRDTWIARLAAAAREEIVAAPPAGAKWAQSAGCGTRIEGEEENVMVACGMAHVPALSQRFLHLFTNP